MTYKTTAAELVGVYAEQLNTTIESNTGLYTMNLTMNLTEMRANLEAALARLDAPPSSEQEWAAVQRACTAVGRAARLEKDAARKRGHHAPLHSSRFVDEQ